MRRVAPTLVILIAVVATGVRAGEPQAAPPPVGLFFEAAALDEEQAQRALTQIAAAWRDEYTTMIVDIARLLKPTDRPARGAADFENTEAGGGQDVDLDRSFAGADARADDEGSPVRRRLLRFLGRQTGKKFGDDLDRWRRWMWGLDGEPHPEYAFFKGAVYGNIDVRMREFFPPGVGVTLRLDQVDWGGVGVNGIPPLVRPPVVAAADAAYLKDKHIVFGITIDGESRAYPKRILAWHELVRDTLGGKPLTLVYCTLCGAVVPYSSLVDGRELTLGTSGLLYRSNKLMFDEETKSLWSSLGGQPVVGPYSGTELRLERYSVVATTWGEWRAAHPETTVLSLDTGFERDYSEGAAYREYFRIDRLMFEVPARDSRLKNKAEVLALPFTAGAAPAARPLAIAASFLARRPVLMHEHAGTRFVVLTSPKGAARVYDAGAVTFSRWGGSATVADISGVTWRVAEDALVADDGRRLERLPSHPAFWFGWYAQYPETELLK
ncbi:MAG: DUF3179 domain-containing protein [bacterium]|nr:DUF3179 domain-containing protein [bacterium]